MSALAGSGPEEKKGLDRVLSRMKTVLKRKDGSKRFSLSGRSAAATSTPSAAGPSTTKASAPGATSALAQEPSPATKTATRGPQPVKIMRSQVDAERANKLMERFKLPKIEAYEFPSRPEKEALRVEKPIRMRIHRTCHKCQTTFGGNKVCASCQHTRCSKCPRYPVRKAKTEGRGKENVAPKGAVEGAIEPDTYWGLRDKTPVLTMPSRTGGQPLVRKKPMQRVRRTCHECSTLFPPGVKICANCNHVRCTDCPRDPAKKKKYPDGYPGDAYSATSTAPLKYSCHHCSKVFPAIPHPQSPAGLAAAAAAEPPPPLKCVRCGHERCPECARAPIVRVEPAPDPDVLRSVEAKLAALNVGEPVEDA